jgi:hypothetical protein
LHFLYRADRIVVQIRPHEEPRRVTRAAPILTEFK